MDFELTAEQKDIQRAAREFAQAEFDRDLALELERSHRYPWEILKKAAKLGLVGICLPEEYGGQGYGHFEHSLIVEEFCRKDSGIGFALSAPDFGSEIILKYGSEEQRKKYLPPLAKGEALSCGAFTEPDRGSDLTSVSTTAVKEGKEYVINGNKTFITIADIASFAVVLCQTNSEAKPSHHGLSNIIVETDREGTEITPLEKMGLHMTNTNQVAFSNVRVPQDNLVGEEGRGFYQAMGFFNTIRVMVGALSVGMAQGAFDRSLDYAKKREAFGKKIGEFQAIQHKLAEMITKIETARLLTYRAAWELDKGVIPPALASMAKWYGARVAVEVADEAIEILGGHGYMLENDVERFYRDARALEILEGTREIHKNLIARAFLGKLAKRQEN